MISVSPNVCLFLTCDAACDKFKKMASGNLGTHSLRKGPATYCSRSGQPKDYIPSRGRWTESKKQVDVYIGIDKPYPDAVIAGCLCGPKGMA